MKTALQIDISFEQILDLVKKLSKKYKAKLEKEAIKTNLSNLLNRFKTKDLSLEAIDEEVELVRQELYEKR